MRYRMQSSGELGVVVWLETPCGMKQPLIRWASLGEIKMFAEMLLDFYNCGMEQLEKNNDLKATSENLLKQALGDEDI